MSKQNSTISTHRPLVASSLVAPKRTNEVSIAKLSGTGIGSSLAGLEQGAVETLGRRYYSAKDRADLVGLHGVEIDIDSSTDLYLRSHSKTETISAKKRNQAIARYELIQDTINRVDKKPKLVIINT